MSPCECESRPTKRFRRDDRGGVGRWGSMNGKQMTNELESAEPCLRTPSTPSTSSTRTGTPARGSSRSSRRRLRSARRPGARRRPPWCTRCPWRRLARTGTSRSFGYGVFLCFTVLPRRTGRELYDKESVSLADACVVAYLQYSDETAELYARQLLDGATSETSIAVVSTPSVFVALKNIIVSLALVTVTSTYCPGVACALTHSLVGLVTTRDPKADAHPPRA